MRSRGLFLDIIDFFAEPKFADDMDLLSRARLLAGILLVFSLTMLAFMAYLLGWAAEGRVPLGVPIQGVMTLGFAGLLLILRYVGAYMLCAHLLMLMATAGVFVGIWVSGGPLESPSLSVIMVPAVMALCLFGQSQGLLWVVLIVVVQAFLIAMDLSGYTFPSLYSQSRGQVIQIHNWTLTFVMVISLMVVAEQVNQRLRVERDEERRRLDYLSTHDLLTGLANRVLFDVQLAKAIYRCQRSGDKLALLCLDIDDFKLFNQELGHEAGDRVLKTLAHRLQSQLRKADTVARLGDDEFAIILEGIHTPEDVTRIADKLQSTVRLPVEDLSDRRVTVSIGGSLYPDHSLSAHDLLRCADRALQDAKSRQDVCVMGA